MRYHTCPTRGSNLDPGERRDCTKEERRPPGATSEASTNNRAEAPFLFDSTTATGTTQEEACNDT